MALKPAIAEPDEQTAIQETCDAFGLGRILSWRDAGGTRNTNVACRTQSGCWLLRRRHEAYSTPEQLSFDHGAAGFLVRQGVPVPAPLVARTGSTWLQRGAQTWEAFRFVPGRPLKSGQPGHARALGEALGRWHLAGGGFGQRFAKGGPQGETTPQLLLGRAETIEREAPETRGIVQKYRRQVQTLAGQLGGEEWAALPHTLIHGDIQPANLLMDGEKLAAFVDLDWCRWQARVYDLCFAILTCCACHREPFDGADIWSLSQTPFYETAATREFLESYQQAAGALTPGERSALPLQLRLTLCHVRLAGALKVAPERRLAFLERPPLPDDSAWLPRF